MRLLSTRGGPSVDISDAIMTGLAADGGLYVPERLPRFEIDDFSEAFSASEIGPILLRDFFEGSELEADLVDICADAFDFPLPVKKLTEDNRLSVLELFHGPTAAFKDVGAQFLAASMERLLKRRSSDPRGDLLILVATSGDTGGAVAAAFHGRGGIRVAVLFPKGQVSPRQEHQLTCWGGNVLSLAVKGSFDDCQALVKRAFSDAGAQARFWMSSANSINVGRLLPQAVYYATTALAHYRGTGRKPNLIIPTGNLGNAMACIWARAMGLPIGRILFATNANRTIPDFLATGDWQPRPSLPTLASAMDVGNPSNMERLRNLVPEFDVLRDQVAAIPVSDEAIGQQIEEDFKRFGVIWCPHTATAAYAYHQLSKTEREADWILVATAHPAKFETIVEPRIGQTVPLPDALADLLEKPSEFEEIRSDLDALLEKLEKRIK